VSNPRPLDAGSTVEGQHVPLPDRAADKQADQWLRRHGEKVCLLVEGE
jgi:hypothetical protein